jgi:hypothetical protein
MYDGMDPRVKDFFRLIFLIFGSVPAELKPSLLNDRRCRVEKALHDSRISNSGSPLEPLRWFVEYFHHGRRGDLPVAMK